LGESFRSSPGYSERRASIGSTRVARRAGSHPAAIVSAVTNTALIA
jgi:hypothetical protein